MPLYESEGDDVARLWRATASLDRSARRIDGDDAEVLGVEPRLLHTNDGA